MTHPFLIVERDGAVLTARLNRPETRNALTEPALIAALSFLVAVCASCELRGFLSQTPAEYAAALRGGHAAAQFIVVIAVVYVQLLAPGRSFAAELVAALGGRRGVVQRQQRDAFAPVRVPKVPTVGAKSAAAAPAGAPGQAPSQSDEPQSITQALRALQGRAPANPDQ